MKVLIIYNIDPGPSRSEIIDARNSNKFLYKSLKDEGIITQGTDTGFSLAA